MPNPLNKFLIPRMALINGNRTEVEVFTAFLRIPNALLDTPIPEAVQEQVYGQLVVGLTLQHLTLGVDDMQDGTSLIALSANYRLDDIKSRVLPTTLEDGEQWLSFLQQFGYTIDDLLTLEERSALLPKLGE